MEKLIKNVIKLIMCTVIFCGTNFGMEKEATRRRVPLNNDNQKRQEHRVKNQKEDDACNERCLESCGNCCLSALLPMTTAIVLIAVRGMQDDIFIESYRAFFTNKST